MMNEKLINFIENSFLKDLLSKDSITDISYNGSDIFYKDNLLGRMKSDIEVDPQEVNQFLRQIANETDNQFSVTDPILDVSVGKYRINATHLSISRKRREGVYTFAIRIGFEELRIKNDGKFINEKALILIKKALKSQLSLAISGKTGTGKTEFQKFLLSMLEPKTRAIIIDNVDEFDTGNFASHLDTQTWLTPPKYRSIDSDDLIRNALRSNPDWIIMGESRGKEMLTILNSAMSGHPTITTLHSLDATSTYNRMARMCMIGNNSLSYSDVLNDICDHFPLVIHVKSYFDEEKKITIRYVDSLGTRNKKGYYTIYKYPSTFRRLPRSLQTKFNMTDEEYLEFNKAYLGKENI